MRKTILNEEATVELLAAMIEARTHDGDHGPGAEEVDRSEQWLRRPAEELTGAQRGDGSRSDAGSWRRPPGVGKRFCCLDQTDLEELDTVCEQAAKREFGYPEFLTEALGAEWQSRHLKGVESRLAQAACHG